MKRVVNEVGTTVMVSVSHIYGRKEVQVELSRVADISTLSKTLNMVVELGVGESCD
jgi:hypothetical protein